MMSGLGLVIDQRRQLPARPFAGIAQIDVEGPGPRAIERRRLVIAAGGPGLRVGGDAADLHGGLRHDAEVLRQTRLQRFDQAVAVIEDLLPTRIGVRIKILRIPGERLRALGDRARSLALRRGWTSMRAVSSLCLREAELMHLLRRSCRWWCPRAVPPRTAVPLRQMADAGSVDRACAGA